jgi:uncharacterized membrane protein HdeD (DUF308 family)
MDIFTFIAGLLGTFVIFGHLIMGIKLYLDPMMNADFAAIPKATMQSVFHYVTVFLSLSAVVLLISGFNIFPEANVELLVKFIGLNFLIFGIVQIIYALKNKIKNPLISMFQWVLFIPIGIFCLL